MSGSRVSVLMDSPRHLICSVNWLGDAVMSLPALQAFRAGNPEAFIGILSKPPLLDFWKLSPIADEVIPLQAGWRGIRRAGREVAMRRFDAAWVLPNSTRAALIPWLGKVPRRVGLPGVWRRALLSDVRPALPADIGHQAREVFHIMNLPAPDEYGPELQVPEAFRQVALERIESIPRPILTLLPGAARGPSKQWPIEHWIALARQMIDRDWPGTFLLCGAPSDQDACRQVHEALPERSFNLAGVTTLPGFAALLQASEAAVVNDSGGMHLAAGLGVPLVALFGITNPDKTGPLGAASIVLQKSDIRSRKVSRDSPEARAALAELKPAEVIDALRQLGLSV